MSMKAKGAANRAKSAGKNLVNQVGNKMRGMKKTPMKGKNLGSKVGKGFKRVKGVLTKGVPVLSKVANDGYFSGETGAKKARNRERNATDAKNETTGYCHWGCFVGGVCFEY